MSLTIGLDIAKQGLRTTAQQTALLTRNVTRVDDPFASRKVGNLTSLLNGGVKLGPVRRLADQALLENLMKSASGFEAKRAISSALNALDATVGDPALGASPTAVVQDLMDNLQEFAARPHDSIAARALFESAQRVVVGLNDASGEVRQVRERADGEIALSVENLNRLLKEFESVNQSILKGTRAGQDVTDELDMRDQLLRSISAEVEIRTVMRADGDMAVFLSSGVTLFDKTAREVSFVPTPTLLAGQAGHQVYVDGVPMSKSVSGRIAGLLEVRDTIAPTYQKQLDEVARGLVEIFAETDQSAVPTLPPLPGLFTAAGLTGVPASGVAVAGLAASIRVNANVDPDAGGDLMRLRDGGISDPGNPAYLYNTAGSASYNERLHELLQGFSTARSFDISAQAGASATLINYASASGGWLGEARVAAKNDAELRGAVVSRSIEALTNATGVNLDEEMSLLLDLERSYQASSRLISTIDNMFIALFDATR